MSEQSTTPNLAAAQAIMTATVSIKRAATGKVEEYQLTFSPLTDPPPPQVDMTDNADLPTANPT